MSGNANQVQTIRGNITASTSASTAGGATAFHYIAAASANQDSTVVKGTPGTLYSLSAYCTQAALRYLKVYDKATGPTSADTPIFTHLIPGNATGAGTNPHLPLMGIKMVAGLGFRLTTGLADSDATAVTANDVVVDVGFF